MFPDYRSLVLSDYQQKASAGSLSSNMIHPKPAKLRDECIAVCSERYDRKDQQILRTFFGEGSHREACLKAIEGIDIDKFRPLVNFLRHPTIDTDSKNIELLAWLIDFKRRPFELGEDYSPGPSIPTGHPPVSPPGISGKPESKSKRKIVISLTITICLAAAVLIFRWPKHKAPATTWIGNEKCMYWTGDHYEPIPCAQHGDTSVVVMDTGKLSHFRKITQTDTITYRSKGAVWYVKVRGNIEFYTSDGFHPIETQLRLRPVTDYIINKYILANN